MRTPRTLLELICFAVLCVRLIPTFAQEAISNAPPAPPPDTDYDGRTDAQELADGTDPNDPASVLPVRLGYWRFNASSAGNPWIGENGAVPLNTIAVQSVPSFDGQAVQITNRYALLRYRDVETHGAANINCRQGSIRLMFKPFWSSQSAGGAGPGVAARLLEMGSFTTTRPFAGCYSLAFEPKGDILWFSVQDGMTNTFTYGARTTLHSNQWYQIILACSPVGMKVWLNDKAVAGYAKGPAFFPPASARARGLAIGSDLNNGNQINGVIDELETFNYPLGSLDSFACQAALSAEVQEAPPRVTLRWRNWPTNGLSIQRRLLGETNWIVLATNWTAWSFFDTNVTLTTPYEYLVGDRYLRSVIAAPPVLHRGKVLLLVDKTLADSLTGELARLTTDLVGDGWSVARAEVERHRDDDWPANVKAIAAIKSRIIAEQQAAPHELKAVLLVGHVPIPYSGNLSPDGHGYRAMPADIFYGDLDGQWTDTNSFANTGGFLEARFLNRAGDGKFDQYHIPPDVEGVFRIEVAVGRIDFAKLPAFVGASFLGAPRNAERTEVALLREHLARNHRYRHKQLNLRAGGIATDTTGWGNCHIYCAAFASAGRAVGWEPPQLVEGDVFATTNAALWGFHFGRSGSDSLSDGRHRTAELASGSKSARAVFLLLDGSYHGDFDYPNSFMRAALAAPGLGLAATWRRALPWRLEHLALGDWLGTALVRTLDEWDRKQGWFVGNTFMAILGDPTLRLFVTAPPSQLRADREAERVLLRWNPSPEPAARFVVLRSVAGLSGTFENLTPTPLSEPTFTDEAPPAAKKLYQVRALSLVTSGSGSFTNSSQGVFVEVP
jgi:hypothetical protein